MLVYSVGKLKMCVPNWAIEMWYIFKFLDHKKNYYNTLIKGKKRICNNLHQGIQCPSTSGKAKKKKPSSWHNMTIENNNKKD